MGAWREGKGGWDKRGLLSRARKVLLLSQQKYFNNDDTKNCGSSEMTIAIVMRTMMVLMILKTKMLIMIMMISITIMIRNTNDNDSNKLTRGHPPNTYFLALIQNLMVNPYIKTLTNSHYAPRKQHSHISHTTTHTFTPIHT